MTTMRAAVFGGKGKIALREVPRPEPGVGEALVRVTLTTICGTDVHILKGEYPVREGLDRRSRAGRRDRGAGPGRDRLRERRSRHRRRDHAVRAVPRVSVGRALAVRPRRRRLRRRSAAGGSATRSTAARPSTCWCPTRRRTSRRSPTARRRGRAAVPDIMSTGFSAAERGHVRIGDTVVVFAQGPIGLCATAGAKPGRGVAGDRRRQRAAAARGRAQDRAPTSC